MSRRDFQTTFCPSVTRRTCDDAIANSRRRFKIVVLGGLGHFALQTRQQRFLFTFEEQHDLVDRSVVLFFGLIADARREATLDVILQARTLAPPVDRFAAGPQRKDRTHEIDQLAQAVRVGVRAEIARAVVSNETREDDARKRLVRYLQVRIPLVVAQPDVERRLVALDQVRLEDQRLDFVRDDDRSNVGDSSRPSPSVRAMVHRAFLKVRSHAVAQRDRLSDVENLAVASDHQIDARRVRDLLEVRGAVSPRAERDAREHASTKIVATHRSDRDGRATT